MSFFMEYKAAVITISDKGSRGEREDTRPGAEKHSWNRRAIRWSTCIIPDDFDRIAAELKACCDERDVALVLTTGGRGCLLGT